MTTLEVLKNARELVAKPMGWTQRSYGRTAEGWSVDWTDECAVAFCIDGALLKFSGLRCSVDTNLHRPTKEYESYYEALQQLGFKDSGDAIIFNDYYTTTQQRVVERFDKAIARLEGSDDAR